MRSEEREGPSGEERLRDDVEVGVIGGSGLYHLAAHAGAHHDEVVLDTPFGRPSAPYRIADIGGRRVAFLARHGDGHRLLPSEVPYAANVWGFKRLGVSRLVSLSACGSLREDLAPRDFVAVDQFVDRTRSRRGTFFGEGLVAHVSLADPTCEPLRRLCVDAGRRSGSTVHDGGTYLCMEGPQFSTRAESRLYRSWGCDVIGMTNATEARLAREAELCFACVAMVTDWDCWKEDEDVTVDVLLGNLRANAEAGERLLEELLPALPDERACGCGSALDVALITDPKAVAPAARERLALLLGDRCRG